jgi:hypothetical protein
MINCRDKLEAEQRKVKKYRHHSDLLQANCLCQKVDDALTELEQMRLFHATLTAQRQEDEVRCYEQLILFERRNIFFH